MNFQLDIQNKPELDPIIFNKMLFIYKALEGGWEIKKNNEKYIFTKPHEDQKEVYLDNYLRKFLENNLDIGNLI